MQDSGKWCGFGCKEQLLFLQVVMYYRCVDVDDVPVHESGLNVDNVFQADECDAFHSDVDEAPTAQTMFMANLSSADPVYDEASPSYDSNILSEDVLKMKAEALKEQTPASRSIKALMVYPLLSTPARCPSRVLAMVYWAIDVEPNPSSQ
ncbi:hypothetical protein Tco_0296300 [Tanacetum coccineum]